MLRRQKHALSESTTPFAAPFWAIQWTARLWKLKWTARLWKLKICCPHPLPESQLLPFVRIHGGNNSKKVFLCICICYVIENTSEIVSICYARPRLNCKEQLCLHLQRKMNSKTIFVCICICYEMPNSFVNNSAPGKWGRTQMGSDGLNRILTGLYFFSPVGVRLVPLKTHHSRDFDQILTGL